MQVTGVVSSFDEQRGDGEIRSDAGEVLYFHCVELCDGSRVIAPGARVSGQRAVGRLGRDEVIAVQLSH